MNPASLLSLAAGREFTQSTAHLCILYMLHNALECKGGRPADFLSHSSDLNVFSFIAGWLARYFSSTSVLVTNILEDMYIWHLLNSML